VKAVRVLRVYHGGRNSDHRSRERALRTAGVDVVLAVPSRWPDANPLQTLASEDFGVVELPVRRAGDVNRHSYAGIAALARVIEDVRPDLLDVHEEPFSVAARQWIRAAASGPPVVMYTAQNIDKRFPPPFASYERQAYERVSALYPCSRQAASVARGKGFAGPIEVLPLGYDESLYTPGAQSAEDAEIVLGFAGRFVPEKGLTAAVSVLAAVAKERPARLLALGSGRDEERARQHAAQLGVEERLEIVPWVQGLELAAAYRRMHLLLVPSVATPAWAEQFGRVVVEAQASGAVVASFASGALPEVAGDGGLVVPEGDTAALGAVVLDVLGRPDDYERRRRAGLALAGERTWTHVAERQAALYERVLAGHTRVGPAGRAAARVEFGPPANTPAGGRPFALPHVVRTLVTR
jgi:glycosyltransferase involved in cell wall biosynthesis